MISWRPTLRDCAEAFLRSWPYLLIAGLLGAAIALAMNRIAP